MKELSRYQMIGNLPVLSEQQFDAAWLRRDYVRYCQYVHNGVWQPGRHHILIAQKISDVVQGKTKRLMIWMPPRHGKSMEVTETFPSYYLGHFPDKNVIEVSYGDDLARRFGESNRAKVVEFGEYIFGIRLSQTNGSKTNWSIEGHSGGMISVGVGGSITGKGADLLILDDPIKNRAEADSETYRKTLLNEWQSTLYTRLHADGAVIVILTRWHENDLAASLLHPDNGEPEEWEVLSLPCVCDTEGDQLGRRIGEALWPEKGYTAKWAKRTRLSVGEYAWYSLYQQKPRPDSGAIFKREWLSKRYTNMPPEATVVQSWDLPFVKNEESAKCAGFVVGRAGANIYVEDCINDKMEFTQTVAAVRDLSAKHPRARAKVIEAAANGRALIDYLKGEIPGLVPFQPNVSKEERARATTPYYEAGNVYFKDSAEWVSGVVEDFVAFPNGRYKDTIDALTQAILYLETVLGAFGGIIYRTFTEEPAKYRLSMAEASERMMDASGRFTGEMVTIGVSLGNSSRGVAFVASVITEGYKDVIVVDTHHCEVHSTPDQIAKQFVDFVGKVDRACNAEPEYAYCDDEGQVVYRTMKDMAGDEELDTTVRMRADLPENDRINLTQRLISQGRLFICDDCNDMACALLEAKWDDRKSKDTRLDDGIADTALIKAFEYTIERNVGRLTSE